MELKLAAITAHNGVLPHCLPYSVFWTEEMDVDDRFYVLHGK